MLESWLLQVLIKNRVQKSVSETFKKYCQHSVFLENISIEGEMVIEEDAQGLLQSQIVRSSSETQLLELLNVDVK